MEKSSLYKPLETIVTRIAGFEEVVDAMRLPKKSFGDSVVENGQFYLGKKDAKLAKGLVRAGDDHAKAMRGIIVWMKLKMQVGFMIEFETYRHGVECLSTSSAMHGELKALRGEPLAIQKQLDLPEKVYTRSLIMSYQVLRAIYHARRDHRHPDWQIFCDLVETFPCFKEFILPKKGLDYVEKPLVTCDDNTFLD